MWTCLSSEFGGAVGHEARLVASRHYCHAAVFLGCLYDGNPDGEDVRIVGLRNDDTLVLVPGGVTHG